MNYLNFDAKIEPIGTMERYVVSPYSAEGGNYYNVDEASTVLLNNLKKIHADAVSLVSTSRSILSATILRMSDARDKANACQAKRDAKSGGLAKNNACHIDLNTNLHNTWGTEERLVATQTTKLNSDIQNLELAKKELDIALENEKKQSSSSPTVIIALDKTKKDAEVSTNKAKKDAEVLLAKTKVEGDALIIKTQSDAESLIAKIKNKKNILLLLVGGLLIVGGIVAYIKFKK